VYGDTDSLFVYLPGKTREEAFDIGEDIAETITRMNPRPIKLKFEKVFSYSIGFDIGCRSTTRAFFWQRNAMSASNTKSGQIKYPSSMQKALKLYAEMEHRRSRKSRKQRSRFYFARPTCLLSKITSNGNATGL